MLKFKNLPSKVCSYKITSYICSVIKNKEIMTTFNKTMTIEEATKLYQAKSGMNYPNTEHNRRVMKQVIDNHLNILRNAR